MLYSIDNLKPVPPPKEMIDEQVSLALKEDIGSGDLTATLFPSRKAKAIVVAREQAVLCGQIWLDSAIYQLDPNAKVTWGKCDGELVEDNEVVCSIESQSDALLSSERTALNFLQLLSGVATKTRQYTFCVRNTQTKIVDTRKTIPGLRHAQKYAVRCGGGINHRMGLYDAILIKENHIEQAGGIEAILKKIETLPVTDFFIQVEVETLSQLEKALKSGVKMILLDNFSVEETRNAVQLNHGRAILESSGGISLANLEEYANTGVNRISLGELTKNIQAIDYSLRHVES